MVLQLIDTGDGTAFLEDLLHKHGNPLRVFSHEARAEIFGNPNTRKIFAARIDKAFDSAAPYSAHTVLSANTHGELAMAP